MKKFFKWVGIFFALGFVGCVAIVILTPSSRTPEQRKQIKRQVKKEVIEIRISPKTGINIRTGPGVNYPKDGRLVRKDNLHVLEEKDGWIRFRITPKDVGWSGWVRKDLTVSKEEWNLAIEKENLKILIENIELLKNEGLLITINPQVNEAFVNSLIWYGIDYQTKENIARTMADYCEAIGDVAWIEIKDYRSGKKLAKYSSWGFKTY